MRSSRLTSMRPSAGRRTCRCPRPGRPPPEVAAMSQWIDAMAAHDVRDGARRLLRAGRPRDRAVLRRRARSRSGRQLSAPGRLAGHRQARWRRGELPRARAALRSGHRLHARWPGLRCARLSGPATRWPGPDRRGRMTSLQLASLGQQPRQRHDNQQADDLTTITMTTTLGHQNFDCPRRAPRQRCVAQCPGPGPAACPCPVRRATILCQDHSDEETGEDAARAEHGHKLSMFAAMISNISSTRLRLETQSSTGFVRAATTSKRALQRARQPVEAT